MARIDQLFKYLPALERLEVILPLPRFSSGRVLFSVCHSPRPDVPGSLDLPSVVLFQPTYAPHPRSSPRSIVRCARSAECTPSTPTPPRTRDLPDLWVRFSDSDTFTPFGRVGGRS